MAYRIFAQCPRHWRSLPIRTALGQTAFDQGRRRPLSNLAVTPGEASVCARASLGASWTSRTGPGRLRERYAAPANGALWALVRATQTCGHPGRRRGRLLAPDGRGRERDARAAEGASPRADRARDRGAWRPHGQADGRRRAGRVRKRGRCRALRGRDPGAPWPDAMPRCPEPADRLPDRHQSRRRDRRGRGHLRRWRQHRGAARGPRRAGRHLRLGQGARRGAGQARARLRGPGRAARSRTSRGRSGSTGSSWRRSGGRRPADVAPSSPLPACRTSRRSWSWRFAEHERRPGAGVFRRRHRRGHHHRSLQGLRPARDRAQLRLRLQGPRRRPAAGLPRARRALRRSKAACARPATGCGSRPS